MRGECLKVHYPTVSIPFLTTVRWRLRPDIRSMRLNGAESYFWADFGNDAGRHPHQYLWLPNQEYLLRQPDVGGIWSISSSMSESILSRRSSAGPRDRLVRWPHHPAQRLVTATIVVVHTYHSCLVYLIASCEDINSSANISK